MDDQQTAIKVENLYKDFILPQEKTTSIKGAFTNIRREKTTKTPQHALKDISFEVKKGEFFGIVGRNGSGKSTLLKILAGIYQPTKGTVVTKGKLVPFIELGVGFNPELTGRENVYLNGAMLGFTRGEIEGLYEDIVAFAELGKFMDQKLKNYSSGMQVRLAFSLATRAEADILLVDEVLAVGDADFQRKCFQYFHQLKKRKKTVVFVSHDMDGIRQYCDRALLIEKNKIQAKGSGEEIAELYTKLFLDTKSATVNSLVSERWGDGKAEVKNIKVEPELVGDGNKEINISWDVVAKEAIEEPLHGFAIKDPDGNSLAGTNTMLSRIKTHPLKSGDKVKIEWTVANVFSEGIYTVVPAVVSSDNTVHDWWEDAVTFEVRKLVKNPYPIHPEITGKIVD